MYCIDGESGPKMSMERHIGQKAYSKTKYGMVGRCETGPVVKRDWDPTLAKESRR